MPCLERTLFDDREIAKLCRLLGFTPEETVNMLPSFTLFKFSHHIDPILKFCGVKLRKSAKIVKRGATLWFRRVKVRKGGGKLCKGDETFLKGGAKIALSGKMT